MRSQSQEHHRASVPGHLQRKSVWGVFFGVVLLGLLVVGTAQAAIFPVNSNADVGDANPGDGICATSGGVCTLRAAIEEANALAGADEIMLPSNTYLLSMVTELTITASLTITGGGASTTIIDGNKSVRADTVLVITAGTVNLSGVTIQNGARLLGRGGGIRNSSTLTLTNSTVSGNSAFFGGGIFNGGTLTLTNSTVSGNRAIGDHGGGIFTNGVVTLTNSTVSGNSANFRGGGIFNVGLL